MNIMIVEDESEQIELIKDCIKSILPDANISETANGQELLDSLNACIELSQLPGLIILDLNMPVMDGRRTLQILKSHSMYSALPVALFSSSINKMDRMLGKFYNTPYFLKSMDLEECKCGILDLLHFFKCVPVH